MHLIPPSSAPSSRRRSGELRPAGRVLIAAAMALALAGTAVACSSDDEPSAQERYCEAGADLQSNVEGLADLDLVAGGTDALRSSLDQIDDDLTALGDAASEAAADDVAALKAAVADVETALGALQGEITSANVSTLSSSISDAVTAAQAVYETLSDC